MKKIWIAIIVIGYLAYPGVSVLLHVPHRVTQGIASQDRLDATGYLAFSVNRPCLMVSAMLVPEGTEEGEGCGIAACSGSGLPDRCIFQVVVSTIQKLRQVKSGSETGRTLVLRFHCWKLPFADVSGSCA